MITDQQVRRLRMLIQTEKTQATAASKAGMDAKTARKYVQSGKLPSQIKKEHSWRTRQDPFEQEWEAIKEKRAVVLLPCMAQPRIYVIYKQKETQLNSFRKALIDGSPSLSVFRRIIFVPCLANQIIVLIIKSGKSFYSFRSAPLGGSPLFHLEGHAILLNIFSDPRWTKVFLPGVFINILFPIPCRAG